MRFRRCDLRANIVTRTTPLILRAALHNASGGHWQRQAPVRPSVGDSTRQFLIIKAPETLIHSASTVQTQAFSSIMASRDDQLQQVPRRHAILHDFCMNIPYGITLLVMGAIAALVSHMSTFGIITASAGIIELVASTQSLRCWKSGASHRLWTTVGAICSITVAYLSYELWRLHAHRFVSGSIGLTSVCMSVFLVYNILSGGNPPPSAEYKMKKKS